MKMSSRVRRREVSWGAGAEGGTARPVLGPTKGMNACAGSNDKTTKAAAGLAVTS